MSLENIACAFPGSLREALELMSDETTRGRPIAGGTDLIVQWESGVLEMPARVVNVKNLPELKGITRSDSGVVVGAGVTHAELRNSDVIRELVPCLAEACATVGGYQMQAQGTLGGNVANASPAGDTAPSLLVADATVVVESVQGQRRIPFRDFLQGYRKIDLRPDELIVSFILQPRREGCREGFRKLGPRNAQAISKVMGSYRGHVENGKITFFAVALGSVAPTAVRLPKLEAWITGQKISPSMLEEVQSRASDEVSPIDDIRSTAEYRKWVSGRIVRGFVERLAEIQ
ncbi:MAG: xanthine dehydrogenase family protein subunit M [Verrucomicrobia bacterium]|nr:xanthine dehydrogenase family protein subunit M [Verrucomicrobiota bacterium]